MRLISEWDETHKKHCIKTIYRVIVNDEIVKEGRFAINQTKNIKNRVIFKRKWNESTKEWIGDWTTTKRGVE